MALKDIDYQDTAVKKVLALLRDSWGDHERSRQEVRDGERDEPRRFAVYLNALTGAGKTIMVGRVLQRLLRDPATVILWLSDSPSLNQQTHHKLKAIIEGERFRTIDKPGTNERMEPGYVYFLNRQKLDGRAQGTRGEMDTRARWAMLREAIIDPTIRLYVVQDEAHRGVVKSAAGQSDPIITSIIEATSEHLAGVDPLPVILGVTATPRKFIEAAKAAGRDDRGHTVPPEQIQASGLIKRTIDFRTPQEVGTKDKNNREAQLGMLDQAVAALKRSDAGWDAFHRQESRKEGYTERRVVPLLLFQVPDGITDDELGEWCVHLNSAWERHFGHILPRGAVAHVLQQHRTIQAGDFELPYCEPQDVQDTTTIRVLVAKLAVSTGWDCPRAEVLYSLRGGSDETYIAQLVGRMVRMPLAERSLSAELDHLNIARVLLPYFTYQTVDRVVQGLRTGEIPSPGEVDSLPVDENPDILAAHGRAPFELVSGLTKAPAPSSSSSDQVTLMGQLAVMVAMDAIPGVGSEPRKSSLAKLFTVLDDYAREHQGELDEARPGLDTTTQSAMRYENWALGGGPSSTSEVVQLDAVGRRAKVDRLIASLPGGLGPEYVKHLRANGATAASAREQTALLAQVEDVVTVVTDTSREQNRQWLDLVERALEADAALPVDEQHFREARVRDYRKRMAQFGDPIPTKVGILGPREVSFGPKDQPFPHWWPKHLLVPTEGDDAGRFRLDAGSWEKRVLDEEVKKGEVVGWYRNPSTGSEHTLQVPWKDGRTWRSAHPDFVFIEKVEGELRPSVVDPHDPDRDGLARLRGMAAFVEAYGNEYERFWAVGNTSSGSSSLRRLDLKDETVRAAIMADDADAHELYADPGVQYP